MWKEEEQDAITSIFPFLELNDEIISGDQD